MKKSGLHRPLFHILLVVLFILIAYSNTFDVPFLFDDNKNIVSNPIIQDLRNFSEPSRAEELSDLRAYPIYERRFIGALTFALNYKLHGLDVTGYHIVNIVIHMCNALLVYFFITLSFTTPFLKRSLIKDYSKYIALFSALFFACHPIQTQAVTYIVQRFTSLAAMFYLLSLIFYIRWRLLGLEDRHQDFFVFKSVFFYLTAVISAVLAMNTKEFSFVLPITLCAYEFMFFEEKTRKRLTYLVPFFFTMLVIPLNLLNTDKPVADMIGEVGQATRLVTDMSRWDYLCTQFVVIVKYIRLIFFPVNQNVDYDFPVYHSFFEPEVLISFSFLMAFFALAVYLFYRYRASAPYTRLISFGIFWLFITLSVESSVIPIVDVIFEHRMYLPAIGIFFTVLTLLFVITERLKSQWKGIVMVVVSALLLIVIVLTGMTFARNNVWRDKVGFWEDVVRKSPDKPRGHYNLANAYRSLDMVDRAIEHYQTAIRLKPDYLIVYNNLGIAYYKKGLTDMAIEQYLAAIEFNDDFYDAYYNLGIAYRKKGWTERAIEQFETAVRLQPEFAGAYNNLGAAYRKKGWTERAIEQYKTAIRLSPDSSGAHFNLGIVYQKEGRIDSAIEQFESVIRLDPSNFKAHYNLGAAYQAKGLTDKAREHFITAEGLMRNSKK